MQNPMRRIYSILPDDFRLRVKKSVYRKFEPLEWMGLPHSFHALKRLNKTTTLPNLKGLRSSSDQIWGVTMVRNEIDIIPHTIQHLLDQGIDHILIADNLSTDGTLEYLQELSANDDRIHLAIDSEPAYYQAIKMTYLARTAQKAGARWIIPFDADEFWFARGQTIAEHLKTLPKKTGYVRAEWHHMIPIDNSATINKGSSFILDSTPRPNEPKVAVHRDPRLILGAGNHRAYPETRIEEGSLYIAHAIYRNLDQVRLKCKQGNAAFALIPESLQIFNNHWNHGAAMTEEQLEVVWADLTAGRPVPELGFPAVGPMVRVKPLSWKHWPGNLLATGETAQA